MDIFHKRLYSFLLKFLGVIIIIAVVALFLYYQFYYKKDNLIKYVPENAVVYATVKLDQQITETEIFNNTWQQIKSDYNLPDIDFKFLNNLVSYNSAFAIIPVNDNQFAYLGIFSLQPSLNGFEQQLEFLNSIGLKYYLLKNNVIERNILIISDQEDIINQVKKISTQDQPSLADKISLVYNLKKLNHGFKGKLYLNTKFFTEQYLAKADLNYQLVKSRIEQVELKDLFLGIKFNDQNMVISSPNFTQTMQESELVSVLPHDFNYSLTTQNAKLELESALSNIKQILPDQGKILDQNLNYYQNLFKFNWENDILELLNTKAQLIVNEKNYVLVLDKTQINDFVANISQLQNIIKHYLAYKYPNEVVKQLPDGTYITQIVKNIDDLEFKTEKINSQEFKFVNKKDLEFAIYQQNELFYLTNSKDLLKNIINQENVIDLNQESSCFQENKTNFSQNIIFSVNKIEQLNNILKHFTTLILSTDLGNTNDFWLCLD